MFTINQEFNSVANQFQGQLTLVGNLNGGLASYTVSEIMGNHQFSLAILQYVHL